MMRQVQQFQGPLQCQRPVLINPFDVAALWHASLPDLGPQFVRLGQGPDCVVHRVRLPEHLQYLPGRAIMWIGHWMDLF